MVVQTAAAKGSRTASFKLHSHEPRGCECPIGKCHAARRMNPRWALKRRFARRSEVGHHPFSIGPAR